MSPVFIDECIFDSFSSGYEVDLKHQMASVSGWLQFGAHRNISSQPSNQEPTIGSWGEALARPLERRNAGELRARCLNAKSMVLAGLRDMLHPEIKENQRKRPTANYGKLTVGFRHPAWRHLDAKWCQISTGCWDAASAKGWLQAHRACFFLRSGCLLMSCAHAGRHIHPGI